MAYEQKQYTESDAVKKFRENMEAHGAYQNKWQPQIDSTMNDILNRKAFQYDVNGDALYQQYKDRYVNLGQQAMMDTMGQAAKLTGGYGNSNAQMVGQQAYQGYLQGLTDKIPELAQAAYQRYAQQGQDLYQRYGLLNTQEQADYNRWATERDWLNNRFNAERVFDYGAFRDTVGDDQWKAQFDEDLRRFQMQWDDAHPSSSGGGGGGSGGDGFSYRDNPGGDFDLVAEATKLAKSDGLNAASKYIDAAGASNAAKQAAKDNAAGVARTEAIKKAQKK